jgi:hypothetical protein
MDLADSGKGKLSVLCEHGDTLLVYINCGKYIDQLCDYHPPKMDRELRSLILNIGFIVRRGIALVLVKKMDPADHLTTSPPSVGGLSGMWKPRLLTTLCTSTDLYTESRNFYMLLVFFTCAMNATYPTSSS